MSIHEEDRRHWEIIGYIRGLTEEVHRLTTELHDHMEFHRHSTYSMANRESSPIVNWGTEEPILTAGQRTRRTEEEMEGLLNLVRADMTPRQTVSQESVTGWDPEKNNV